MPKVLLGHVWSAAVAAIAALGRVSWLLPDDTATAIIGTMKNPAATTMGSSTPQDRGQ